MMYKVGDKLYRVDKGTIFESTITAISDMLFRVRPDFIGLGLYAETDLNCFFTKAESKLEAAKIIRKKQEDRVAKLYLDKILLEGELEKVKSALASSEEQLRVVVRYD